MAYHNVGYSMMEREEMQKIIGELTVKNIFLEREIARIQWGKDYHLNTVIDLERMVRRISHHEESTFEDINTIMKRVVPVTKVAIAKVTRLIYEALSGLSAEEHGEVARLEDHISDLNGAWAKVSTMPELIHWEFLEFFKKRHCELKEYGQESLLDEMPAKYLSKKVVDADSESDSDSDTNTEAEDGQTSDTQLKASAEANSMANPTKDAGAPPGTQSEAKGKKDATREPSPRKRAADQSDSSTICESPPAKRVKGAGTRIGKEG
jgi:hypothetical protein